MAPSHTPADLAQRLAVDVACVVALVRGVYFRRYGRSDLFLTFFAFNLVVFLVTRSLASAELSLGAAFGLFAVFSMLRYRTEGITATDMTYLFLVIAVGLLSAIAGGGWREAAVVGGAVLACTALLESDRVVRRERSQQVHYESASLASAATRAALIDDLRARTGLAVHRVEVHEVDYVRDAARLTIYYHAT
jgi:hypothetical protein